MANRKISDLTSLTAPATGDLLPIVDISEAAAVNKNKKITYGELLASAPAGTAAAPSFSFDADPNTGLYSAGADQVAITTGGSGRLFVDASGNVGFGTATPGTLAHLRGTANVTLRIEDSTGSYADLNYNDNGTTSALSISADPANTGTDTSIRFNVDGSERLRITANAIRTGAADTSDAVIQIGASLSGNRNSYLDLVGDTTYSAYGLRVIRNNSGANATSRLLHRGTGNLDMVAQEAAPITFLTTNTERVRIDSSGRLLVGTSSAYTTRLATTSVTPRVQVTDIGAGGFFIYNSSAAANPATIYAAKSRGNDYTSIVQNGDNLFKLSAAGADGTQATEAASIAVQVDGTPGTDDMPGRLVFGTTSDGAASPTERMRIDSSGNVGIGASNPQYKLDISPDAAGAAFRIRAGTSGQSLIQFTDNGISAQWGVITTTAGSCIFEHTSVLRFTTASSERARIDSSGRLLVGTSSSSFSLTAAFQGNSGNTAGAAVIHLRRGEAAATITSAEILGVIRGTDNADNTGAEIQFVADGTWGASDYPTRITFTTVPDGSAVNTERLRITNDGVIAYDQPAPAAVNATATLTVANLKAGIITSTSAAATDMTLPTGTDTQAGFFETYDNFTFEWSVINTGPSLVRVLAGTAHTVVGSGSVATGTSGRFASRRTAANTFVSYRLA